jgi:hypothetical protein
MRDIYQRLAAAGLKRRFLLKAVLPDWWNDALAKVPANRELAEIYLSKSLGLRIAALRDPARPLDLPIGEVRFKRSKRAEDRTVATSAFIAWRAGQILAEAIDLPAFERCSSPVDVREWIFGCGHRFVDLQALLDFCWEHGVIVYHLGAQPEGQHRLDGMAMFCGSRPAIMLGSKRSDPAWLAFHLAHELAHVLRNHVSPGSAPLADSDLQANMDRDVQEAEANRWALWILTGSEEPVFGEPGLGGVGLSSYARRTALAARIDPGVICLVYAQRNNAWPQAALALKSLGRDQEAKALIDHALRAHTDPAHLPEAPARFLEAVLAA